MKVKLLKRVTVLVLLCLMTLTLGVSSYAATKMDYSISAYDVNVRINSDGSLDVTESVKYTSFGGYNNTVLLIDKREGEEIEIENVYMLKKEGYIECDKLSAGQWDANVFNGTYSVIQENNLVRVKVYGSFSNRYGSIVMHYSVKNAIKRYGDVAEYRRSHIQKNWEGRISNINITVFLPINAETTGDIKPFLHGVIVGKKKVESKRSITFNVPDTVPGEYVETRIVFPEEIMYGTQVTDDTDHLETILDEEREYDESDKSELLRARENAAKEAGRNALRERIEQRTRTIASVFSILAALFGLYTLYRIQKKLRLLKMTPIPLDIKDIDELRPSEVRLLTANGKTGARAFLGSLLYMTSLGFIKLGIKKEKNNKNIMTFSIAEKMKDETLTEAEKYLLMWIAGMLDDSGVFDPSAMSAHTNRMESAANIKIIYDKWEKHIYKDFSEKNKIDSGMLFYRNLGLIMGAILFFLGCVIPVSLSIWAGYSMLPVGLILYLYVLRIGKHTDYSTMHHRLWRELKKRLQNRAITLDGLPVWMNGSLALLSYNVALGAEKELNLVMSALKREENVLSDFVKNDEDNLEGLVFETLAVLDTALSSVQDI